MPNIKKVFILSIAALIAQAILTKGLYPLLNLSTQTIFSINPVSGVGGTQVGDTLLGYLSGYIPFDNFSISVWIAMFIGIFFLIYAGFWVYESKYGRKIFRDRNLTQRLFLILLYGHVILYAVLYALKMSVPGIALSLLIGLTANLVGLSVILALSAKYFDFPKV